MLSFLFYLREKTKKQPMSLGLTAVLCIHVVVWRRKYIYIFISRVIVNESKQAQRPGQRSDAAGGRGRAASDGPTSQTGSTRSFHQSPVTQSAVTPSPSHTTLLLGCQGGEGGGGVGAVSGALIQQQLLSFFSFEDVLCSFFLLLFEREV